MGSHIVLFKLSHNEKGTINVKCERKIYTLNFITNGNYFFEVCRYPCIL